MKRNIQRLAILGVLTIFAAACGSAITTDESQPSSAQEVETMVAMTLQALAPEATTPPSTTPDAPKSLLPHTFFYLGKDGAGYWQVFRIGTDGKTGTQLTFEETDVTDYDVSLADGRVAYVANNQLSLILADGTYPRVLVDGGPRENNYWVTNPVFSPDGKTLAYGHKGLNLYDLSAGVSQLVVADQNSTETLPNGLPFPIETYEPERYSPDGTKLLVALGHWEVAPSHAVYDLNKNEFVKSSGVDVYGICCSFHGGPAWSPDGASFYGIASEHDFAFLHGSLWRVDAATGTVTTLISLVAKDGTMNLPYEPYLAPDGNLYYFFLNYPEPSEIVNRMPLQLVRSAADGVTDRTVLRPETFERMTEALWFPDASSVVVAFAPSDEPADGGQAEIVYLDGRPNVVLAPLARQMKWGP
jgi:Tol biopolymer transport system component